MNVNEFTEVADYFRRFTASADALSDEKVWHRLAAIFKAQEVGVASLDGKDSAAFPWGHDESLRKRLRDSFGPITHCQDQSDWLMCMIEGSEVMWVRRPAGDSWTEAQQWAWMFASQTFQRWRDRFGWASESRLEQAAVVAGRLSHDFGNYLTGILGFTELALTQVPAEGLLQRYLKEVLQSAREGAAWIHRLHLFCRRSPARPWPTPLAALLAVMEASHRSSESRLDWRADVPPDLPLLDIDSDALQTVLSELIANAREACGQCGSLTFSARTQSLTDGDCRTILGAVAPGEHVALEVTDDGPGITAEDRGRLLREPFFSAKPRHRGLGLLVVYGILSRFGGGLRLTSAGARGTTVQLYLPTVNSPPVVGKGQRVLLVHTNPLLLESMTRVLEAGGYRVKVATSAQAAQQAYSSPGTPIALTVTDLQLPQGSGVELARRILEKDAEATFLFLHSQTYQGFADEDLLKRYRILHWPVDPQMFLNAVQAARHASR